MKRIRERQGKRGNISKNEIEIKTRMDRKNATGIKCKLETA